MRGASVLYAYQRLYGMTGNPRYLLYAGKHAEIVRKLVHRDEAYDLMYGNAGAVIRCYGRLSGYCGDHPEYERILTGLLARENALFRERLSGRSESEQR